MPCGLSGSGRPIGHAALDEGVANVKHFTGIRENRAYPQCRLGFGQTKMAKAEFGKVGLIVQLDEFLAKTAEALSKFGQHCPSGGFRRTRLRRSRRPKTHSNLIRLRANLEKVGS